MNVRDLLEDIVAAVRAAAITKSIFLDCFVPDTLPETCLGDEKRIRQVLMHLCENAIKYTERGFVRIRADFEPEGLPKPILTFSVEDSGIGIAPENLDFIFQPFTQLDGSLTRRQGGTGVGLSIVKGFVGLMGGRFGVNSTVHVGSRFWFALPIDVVTSPEPNPAGQLIEVA